MLFPCMTPPALILPLSLSSFNSLVVKCQALGSCNTKKEQDGEYGGVELKVVPQFVMHDESELWTPVCACICVAHFVCLRGYDCKV